MNEISIESNMVFLTKKQDDIKQIRIRMPDKKNNEMFALAESLLGGSRVKVICEDGRSRMARIPGSIKRKQRIRTGDLLIIKPWDVQNDKADIVYRYNKTRSIILSRKKLLPEDLDVF